MPRRTPHPPLPLVLHTPAPPPRAFFAESAEWGWIVSQVAARIEVLRDDLENTALTETETAAVRGRVSELRNMLALPDEAAALATGIAPDGISSGAVLFDPSMDESHDRRGY